MRKNEGGMLTRTFTIWLIHFQVCPKLPDFGICCVSMPATVLNKHHGEMRAVYWTTSFLLLFLFANLKSALKSCHLLVPSWALYSGTSCGLAFCFCMYMAAPTSVRTQRPGPKDHQLLFLLRQHSMCKHSWVSWLAREVGAH